VPREPHQISIKVKAPEQPYCFLIRPFDAQFDAVETAVTDAAKACSLLVATSTNIQDQLQMDRKRRIRHSGSSACGRNMQSVSDAHAVGAPSTV